MLFKFSQGADYIVAGLGNPGSKYDNTRHNVGFASIDYMADKAGFTLNKSKFQALYGVWNLNGKKILVMKPQTYMNLSGDAIGAAAKFYKIPPQNVIIINDDISLPVGRMRIRKKGSAGGHNGLKSIISHIGEDFMRIKIGVGEKPNPEYDLAAWVMGKFTDSDKKLLAEKYENAYKAVMLMVNGEVEQAMNLYNNK